MSKRNADLITESATAKQRPVRNLSAYVKLEKDNKAPRRKRLGATASDNTASRQAQPHAMAKQVTSPTHKRGVHNVRSHDDPPVHKFRRRSSERRSFTDRKPEIRKDTESAHDVPCESSSLEHPHVSWYAGSDLSKDDEELCRILKNHQVRKFQTIFETVQAHWIILHTVTPRYLECIWLEWEDNNWKHISPLRTSWQINEYDSICFHGFGSTFWCKMPRISWLSECMGKHKNHHEDSPREQQNDGRETSLHRSF